MPGVLKVKVGGVWVPAGTPGPPGAPGAAGPPGTPAAKAKARAFNANFSNGGNILQGGIVSALPFGTVYLADGITKLFSGSAQVQATSRYLVQANVTVYGGGAGNWMTFQVTHQRYADSVVINNYDVVAQNTSTGYHQAAIAFTVDASALDYFTTKLQPDASPGPYLDNRSWISITEVAW